MVKPTEGNLYIQRKKAKEKITDAGIIMSANLDAMADHDKVMVFGTILDVYDGCKTFKKGEKVVFPRYEGWPIDANTAREGDEFLVEEKFIKGKLST